MNETRRMFDSIQQAFLRLEELKKEIKFLGYRLSFNNKELTVKELLDTLDKEYVDTYTNLHELLKQVK